MKTLASYCILHTPGRQIFTNPTSSNVILLLKIFTGYPLLIKLGINSFMWHLSSQHFILLTHFFPFLSLIRLGLSKHAPYVASSQLWFTVSTAPSHDFYPHSLKVSQLFKRPLSYCHFYEPVLNSAHWMVSLSFGRPQSHLKFSYAH